MPTLAVDVPTAVFDTMCRSSAWLTEEETWKQLTSMFPTGQAGYAGHMREAFLKRKSEGWGWVLGFSVKEERMGLVPLS